MGLDEPIFDGTLMWMGTGHINFPQLAPGNQYVYLPVNDTLYPVNGFEDVCNPYNHTYDYLPAWLAVQKLDIVRSFIQANPTEKVKLFLYRPSAGGSEPNGWSWIIFMRN